MQESDLLRHLYQRSADLSEAFPRVLVGPGDDCAVVRWPGLGAADGALLLKVDQVIESRHFLPFPQTPVDLIGRKAIARAVSDIAAMAGTPFVALCAAAIPAQFPRATELFDAAARWARHFGCPLVGGDIASTPGPLSLSITIVGSPHSTRGPVLRSTAQPGDTICVTGAIGGSLDPRTGMGRHLTFEPRVSEAAWLATELGPRLHAMMDISDGLGLDAARMAHASGVAITLDGNNIPLTTAGGNVLTAVGEGEDYELLFCVAGDPPTHCPGTGVPITAIGRVAAGKGCVLRRPGHGDVDVATQGWEHGRN